MTDRVFPPELERLCFELAAREDTRTASHIVQTCRRAHIWIDFILYESITLQTERSSTLLLRTLNSNKRTSTRALCFNSHIPPSHIQSILGLCPSATKLAFLDKDLAVGQVVGPHSHRPTHLSLPPQSISSGWAPGGRHLLGFLSHVTHLDLTCSSYDWQHWGIFGELMRRLTHVAFSNERVETARTLLRDCWNLEICLFLGPARKARRFQRILEVLRLQGALDDIRFVVLPEEHDRVAEWQAQVRRTHNMWTRAEDIVEERQKAAQTNAGLMVVSSSSRRYLCLWTIAFILPILFSLHTLLKYV